MVSTDMGKANLESFAKNLGITVEQVVSSFGVTSITPAESGEALAKLIKDSTRATHGGKFWAWDGSELAY